MALQIQGDLVICCNPKTLHARCLLGFLAEQVPDQFWSFIFVHSFSAEHG